ncbi:MAG: nucleoside hydrolase [Lentisphaerae bacterium]|nr:nucleoside hydrolase [Lentisphaerota bacterium]
MTKLIIDTDPGQDIDDLLALAFALRRPELDIRAITTVTLPSDRRARLVKRLLRYLDRTDIPVAAGMPFPLRPFTGDEAQQQRDFARTMNHDAFAQPEDSRDDPGMGDAVDLIIRTIEAHPGEVVLACLAPLTNVACALQRQPEIAGKIKAIALMGGETALNRVEHNIGWDYVAADVVLSTGIPLAMGTWDVTRRFVLSSEDCAAFARSASPLDQALARAIALWHPVQSWKPGPVMYDLFPIVWAFAPAYYTMTPMRVRVETRGEHTCGMTVAGPGVPNADVTTDIRAAELRDLYLRTVLGGGDRR